MAVANDFIFIELDSGQNCFILPCYWQTGLLWFWKPIDWSIQFSSITQSCLTLCNPMDCSTPGFPVHHQLPELTQTHVHRVADTIQPSHPLSSPSLPSQYQGLFQWVSSSHQVTKYWSFILSISPSNEYSGQFPLGLTGFIPLLSKWLSRVLLNATVQKQQLFGAQFPLWSNSHFYTWPQKKP